jgi:hypothetical protein
MLAAVLALPGTGVSPMVGQGQQDARRLGEVTIETRRLVGPDGGEIVADVGRIAVPENRTAKNSRTIEIAFVRLR